MPSKYRKSQKPKSSPTSKKAQPTGTGLVAPVWPRARASFLDAMRLIARVLRPPTWSPQVGASGAPWDVYLFTQDGRARFPLGEATSLHSRRGASRSRGRSPPRCWPSRTAPGRGRSSRSRSGTSRERDVRAV